MMDWMGAFDSYEQSERKYVFAAVHQPTRSVRRTLQNLRSS